MKTPLTNREKFFQASAHCQHSSRVALTRSPRIPSRCCAGQRIKPIQMKHMFRVSKSVWCAIVAAIPAVRVMAAGSADNPNLLWYDQPAIKWVQALPVGNGRLGGMIFGGT